MKILVKNKDLDKALKDFKKRISEDGILTECKKREYYLSRTQRRKLKDKEAEKRLRLKLRKRGRRYGK